MISAGPIIFVGIFFVGYVNTAREYGCPKSSQAVLVTCAVPADRQVQNYGLANYIDVIIIITLIQVYFLLELEQHLGDRHARKHGCHFGRPCLRAILTAREQGYLCTEPPLISEARASR